MNLFDLLDNYIDNLEALFRRTRGKLKKAQASSSIQSKVPSEEEDHQRVIHNLTPTFEAMVNKSLREFSTPTTNNIWTGPAVDIDRPFELKPTLINMVQASQFCGKAHEDASAHLQHFLEICRTFTIKDVPRDAYYFAFSHSHSWGERSSGFMQIRGRILCGHYAPPIPWQSSFP
jgi:hypothetical protein